MRIQNRFLHKLGGFSIAWLTRGWMSTLDYRAYFYDETVDPAHADYSGPAIFLFWHEYIPLPFYLRGHCNIAMLLSRHQDAEWLSKAARHMGFDTIRGSTNRGGVAAIRQLLRASRTMNLTLTPDGPQGPRRRLAPGAIFVASRLEIPIIAMGMGYDRPWRMRRTWDQFAVPRPFSRARVILSPKIHVPVDLDRSGLEDYRRKIEATMTDLTVRAEQWAESGLLATGQVTLRPRPAPLRRPQEEPIEHGRKAA